MVCAQGNTSQHGDTDCSHCVLRAGVAGGYGPTPVAALCDYMRRITVQPRQLLFLEGTVQSLIYFLQDGRIKLQRKGDDGEHHVVSVLHPGDLFGFASIDGQGACSTAEAVTHCQLCVVTAERLTTLMGQFPALGVRLLAYMHEQVVNSRLRMSYLGSSRAESRVAGFLLDTARQHGGTHTEMPRELTLVEMGGILGLSPETVSRTLSRLKSKGWIKISRASISLTDPEALKSC